MLELEYHGRSVEIPAWIMPGQADQSITVFLGHGRRRAGRVGTGVGVDVSAIAPFGRARGSAAASKSRRPGSGGGWPPCIIISAWKEGI